MMWMVYRNGRYLGLIESNYEFASAYWRERERITKERFKLVPVKTF